MIINTITSAIIQILLFSMIPFLIYLGKNKTYKDFWQYIGLIRPTKKAVYLAFLLMLLIALPILILIHLNEDFKSVLLHPNSVTGSIREMGPGFPTFVIILVTALLKTALAEEIFFRGFLAKRLIAVTNFELGNWIHAILFGLIHALLFWNITQNMLFLTLIFVIPTISSYLKVYLNEKLSNGSIIPGWVAHASANTISYSFIAFGV